MSLSNSVRAALAGASALALAACQTVGPEFQHPADPKGAKAAGYVMAGDPAAAGVSLNPEARAAGPWWNVFGSPELDQTIRAALADSPTLAAANATLQRAQADARAAKGDQQVKADANASAQKERINTQAFGFTGFPSPTIPLYSVGGTVSYDLDLFGGERRATEAARAKAEAAARQADAAYLTLSSNVALQAMTVAGLRAEIASIQQIVDDDQRLVDMAKRAQAAGGEAPTAANGVVAALIQDRALIPPLERQLAAARHQLALLSGKSPGEWTPPDFDLAKIKTPAVVEYALPSTLVHSRPDILESEAELHAATAQIGVTIAAQYPDIRLTANLTQSSIKPLELFNYSSSGWNLLSGVAAPILNGGKLKARQAAAEAEARASLARYQSTVLRAFTEVSDALSDLGADDHSIANLITAQRLAQASLTDYQNGYRLGGVALLQVIDAQRVLNQVRRALVQAQAQRYSDLVRLYAATAATYRPDRN